LEDCPPKFPRGRRSGKGGSGNGNGAKGEKSTKNAKLEDLPTGWDVASFYPIIHLICVWIPVGLSSGVSAFSVFRFCGVWIGGGLHDIKLSFPSFFGELCFSEK